MSFERVDAIAPMMAHFTHHLLHTAGPFLSSVAQAFLSVSAEQSTACGVPTGRLSVEEAK